MTVSPQFTQVIIIPEDHLLIRVSASIGVKSGLVCRSHEMHKGFGTNLFNVQHRYVMSASLPFLVSVVERKQATTRKQSPGS